MNEKTKKAQKATTVTSLADRYSFGHKALSVVLSVVLLGFGWPAVNPAEVFANDDAAAQSEAAQAQTSEQNTAATQEAVPVASEQASEAPSAGQAAAATEPASSTTQESGSQSAAQSSPAQSPASEATSQAKSEYDIALNLNNASIKNSDGSDSLISLPSTKITVPANKDFSFTVVSDNGYDLEKVVASVDGTENELSPNNSGVYAIAKESVAKGATITLVTHAQPQASNGSASSAVAISEIDNGTQQTNSDQTAYFYLACYDTSLNGEGHSSWLYAGTGTVNVPTDAAKGTELVIGGNGSIVDEPTYFKDKTIKIDGKTYTYDADGTKADGTYSIAWDKISLVHRSSDTHNWANDPDDGSWTEWLTDAGSLDWHVDGRVVLNGEGSQGQYTEQNAYFYLARPDSAININSTSTWLYAGTGTVKAPTNAEKGATLTSGVDDMVQTAGDYYKDKTFTIDGTVYKYDADGTKAAGTYSIVWDSLRLAGGSTNSNKWDGESGNEERLTPTSQLDWHVDGHIVLNTDQVDSKELAVKNAPQDVDFNGNVQKWEPEVIDARTGEDLATSDYSVVYSTDDFVNPAEITATISGEGAYADANELTATYTIKQTDTASQEDTEYEKWISVGESKTIAGTTSVSSGSNWWLDGSDNGVIEFTKNGDSATVKGLKAGTARLVHGYYKGWLFATWTTETYTIHVFTSQPAKSVSISGDDSVAQFASTQLSAATNPANASGTYTWASSNEDILTVDNNGNVTGVRQGTATVTVTFKSAADGSTVTASKDVTVKATTAWTDKAEVYYLLDPTKDANSNDSGNWGPKYGVATVNLEGATWTNGKNCFDNVDQRVISWPNGTNVVSRDSDAWKQIFEKYRSTIQDQLPGVDFTEDDVEEIALVPAKISRNNGTNIDKHLDCNVTIKCKNVSLVKYYLRDAGSTQFEQKGAKNYVSGSTTQPSDVTDEQFPATKVVGGVTYTFSGWYLDRNFTQPATFPYTVNDSTSFYAKYVGGFQVIYDLDGGTWGNSDATMYSAQEGSTQTVKAEPTREGYEFTGWTVEGLPDATTVNSGDIFTMPAGNVTIKANWEKKTVNYKVEYYWYGSDTPLGTDNGSGKYGDVVDNIVPKSFDGYTPVSNDAQTLTLSADESKNVVKVYYYKNVTLTANSDTKTYNGSEQSVEGYTTNLPEGTIISFAGIVLNGGKGTNAGDYAYTFADGTVGKVSTDNNYIVTEAKPGNLHISPVTNEVTIAITGHKGGEKYNGEEQTVEGYDIVEATLPTGVAASDVVFAGTASVSGTNANTYMMGLEDTQFSLSGDAARNYTHVKFEVKDGELNIGKRQIWRITPDGQKNYDGAPLVRKGDLNDKSKYLDPAHADEDDGFIDGEGFAGKETFTWKEDAILPGEYDNTVSSISYKDGTNSENYDVHIANGKLKINEPSEAEKHEIKITANSADAKYDGEDHSATGFTTSTLTFDTKNGLVTYRLEGVATSNPTKKDAGDYENAIDLSEAKVFDEKGNNVTNFVKLTPVNGKLAIAQRNVMLVSESQDFTYDGQDHDWQKVNVDPNSDGFANGESVTYKDFASIKDVGTKDNSFDFDWNNAKEQNYNIDKRYGSLTVSAGDISKYVTLNTTDVEETYNGEHHVAGEASAIDENGNSLVVEYQKSDGNWTTDRNEVYAVNVGEYGIVNVRVSSPANYGEGNYVTGTEKLVVKPIDIELTAKSDERSYDGTVLTNDGYDITNGAFVGDEGLDSVTVSGSQLEVGRSSNVIDAYALKGNTKAENYNITTKPGTLEVTASHAAVVVTIEGNKDSQKYNGSEQRVSGYEVAGVTVDGQEFKLYPASETDFTFSGTATAARTDAGTTKMGLSAEQFKNVNGNFSNVTFEVVEDGSMTVTPREVTLTSATDEKPYDGTALTNSNVTVSGDGFVAGQGFTADVKGSQINAGSSENTFTYKLTESTNADNYQITTSNGTLTVKPISDLITVTIVGKTATGTYNGKEFTAEGYTFDSTNDLFTEGKVSFSGTAKAARTDAGKTEMGLTTDKFSNADTTNFTNVRFVVTDGYVDISTADVTLKSADLTKPYDGTALVNGETALATESGFAEGEGATYAFTGSQTVVGSSANAFSYELNDNTKADNYNIAKTDGTLTVTNRDAKYGITVKANSATATYDGKQHSAAGIETNEFEVNGNKYIVSGLTTEDPVKTNAGTYSNNITGTAVVTDAQGNDVSDQFEVTTENGSLVIDKATVSMKSASDEWTYDGNEHTKHEMKSVKGFAEGEGATFTYTGAITNAGEAKNTYTYTLNANTSAENYTFAEPEYGTLKVSPIADKVTVTIKGHQETKPYNGSEQSVTGYDFSVDNGLYAQSNVKFTGEATAKGTAVGTYNMNLVKEQFANTSNNFSNVEFVVEDGWLKIEGGQIDQNGVVWNTHDNQKVYEGTPLAAYAATATDKYGNTLNVEYSIDGKTWTSDPSQITITHFGYQEVQLRATGSNYADGQYATSSESIAITKRLVTLTSGGGNKPYDGTPLTNGTVAATSKGEGVGFVDGEGASFNVTGSQTEAGESDNTFTYTFNKGTNGDDYWVTTKYGKLIVTADDTEVVVIITEKSDSFEYDGNEKSVSGYDFEASNKLYKDTDFTFIGNDTVKGTNVGTYNMELKPSDFTNNNQNFSKVTFVIVDGHLTITPKSVETGENMTVEAPRDVKYSGQPQQEKPVVKDGEKILTEGTDYTLSYSSDTTNVGTVTVTVTGKGNYTGSVDVTYKILKRSVVLTSVTDSKPYDGTALTRPNVTVTGDGFVDGEVTNILATGSVTTVAEGEVTNTIVYGEGANFKADNYDITKNEGKLFITALSAEDGLAITPHNVEYTYNAESHSAGSASASASVLGVNVSLEYRVKGSPDTEWRSDASVITAINAGTVTIEVRASADNYSGYKYAEQTLTINKRDVELTSASASKVYDGTALTKDWVDMGPNRADTGFIWTDLAGDGRVHATGSQTEVGTSNNTISYQLKDGAANNYNILSENLGTLAVTAQSIVPDPENPESYTGVTISNPSDSVYNGEEHKWTPEVKDAKGNALIEGTDYTVSYDTSDFIDAKSIAVTITGKGNYIGTATKTYKITPAPLTVNASSDSKVYDGDPLIAGGTIDGLVGEEKASAKTEGSQTEVGSSENKVVGIEWGTAKESNYYIQSQNDGTLTVTGKSIAASDMTVGDLHDVVYSGTEQVQKPEVKDGEKTLVEGTDYDLTFSEDKINVGTVTVTVAGKGNYTGEVTRTYQITPATLTVTTPSDSKTYDGDALTAEGAISGFVNGETADFTTTGTQTKVGSSTNTYVIDWTAAGNTAKQGNYTITENLGTLTVTEATDEISAAPGSYNGTYDGQAHGVDVTVTGLPKGYSVKSAVSYATATDVTDGVTANVDELVIVNAQGEDVTANLKITKGTGTIKITPATLKVTTHGAKAEYNGSALTAGGKVTGFVNNEAATLTTTGSQTLVGKSTNTYAIDWNDTAKKENYTIEEELGTLEVTQNMTSIMVIPQGGSKPYDGTALTSAGVTTYGLPAGYTLTATTKGSVTNVGSATAEVDTYSIKDAAGEDVTSQFGNVFTGKATLQVTKRLVTVVSASASKVYDGTALTKPEASVTEGSFATGESFSYDFSGEQTTVGSTSNAYTIKAAANTDLNNYEITKVDGTLTVTAQSINPTDPTQGAYAGVEVDSPSNVTYDANEHKWTPEVKDVKGNALVEGADYDVTYSTNDFTNVTGAITVTITGKGNYTGTVTRIYQITPASVTLSSNSHEFIYNGEPQGDASVNVTGAAELFQSQVNDLKATGSVTNVGDVAENLISYNWNDGFTADNYSIETSFGKLSVVAKNIDTGKDMSVNDPVNVTYNGGDQTWAPTVNDGEKTLVEGSDYTASYSTEDRTNVTGAITVTIVGKGNYTGELTRTYQVLPKAYTVVTGSASKVYDGEPLLGTDAKVAPANMVEGLVNASDATFSVTGSQTEVGGTPNNNTYELTFASEQMAKNYTLAGEQLGTLTVTEYADEIVVTTTGGTFTYDGQAHGATVSVSELPEGYTLEKAESSASAANVADGTVVATADTLAIRNAQGKDVTGGLKIRKIDGEIEITPAPLSIETGSATKTYDGSALTNATLKVDGLVAGDVVTGRTTGSQTEVGSSANTYTLTWGEVDAANYEITEQLGVLTVEAAVVPVVPGPQQPSGPVVVPPTTPEPAGPADIVADALEGAYETATGDKAAEEQIYDSENPLGKEQAAHCWVHWYMILAMILTALYGVAVWLRRGNHTRKLKNDMNNILGGGDDGKDPSGSPVATNHPAGMEA